MNRNKASSVGVEPTIVTHDRTDRYTTRCGNLLEDESLRNEFTAGGPYDVILANIVADVIIPLAPQVPNLLAEGGTFLCSGIIDTRAEEVAEKLRANGLEITDTHTNDGWYAFTCR